MYGNASFNFTINVNCHSNIHSKEQSHYASGDDFLESSSDEVDSHPPPRDRDVRCFFNGYWV